MNEERAPRIERLLERTARKMSGGGLHPLELIERIEAACSAAVRDGVAPNVFDVGLSASDYKRLRAGLPAIVRQANVVLDAAEQRQGWRRLADRRISFREGDGVPEGSASVAARFSHLRRPRAEANRGLTSRITRHEGLTLVVDGTRVALSHTPFAIGRGPGNDLVIASLSVSRRHAVIEARGRRLVIRDLGSRNGLVVGGQPRSEAELVAGMPVALGDIEIVLEDQP